MAEPPSNRVHGSTSQPLHKITAAEAFQNLKTNGFNSWPRVDDADNRFASFADPYFKSGFALEPGQKIFTIGSCFARNIEKALADKGFDIPTRSFAIDKREWAGDPVALLNNYVPASIAPQIRWAFGLETFDIETHCLEARPGRYVDLQLTSALRPLPREDVIARRERINAVYRHLAASQAVVLTLGYVEAWHDRKSHRHINTAPPKSVLDQDTGRFELHVLDYEEVHASLVDLVALLDQVCPSGYRIILTVSPVPLTVTFTREDVAIANMYSKSVLRAAAGALAARYAHIDYFPSYESVLLSARHIAFAEDQIHATARIVRFNVDRLLGKYVDASGAGGAADIIEAARAASAAGGAGVALKMLQTAWAANPGDPELTIALAKAHIGHGAGETGERMLLKLLEGGDNAMAHALLARRYNDTERHEEAARHAEQAAAMGVMKFQTALERARAYFHLGRYEEGWELLGKVRYALDKGPLILHWKARFLEKLGRFDEAEALHAQCTGMNESPEFMLAFAEFLLERDRNEEAGQWVRRALALAPNDKNALRLLGRLERRGGAASPSASSRSSLQAALAHARRLAGFS